MVNEIKAPTFPESVQDGVIAIWHKQAGERVARDELLVEIETDKVILEVVASVDGIMGDIVKAKGDTILSGEVIGNIIEGSDLSFTPPSAETFDRQNEVASGGAIAGPSARKLAAEKDIDLTTVTGTGKHGLISKEDVEKAAITSAFQSSSVVPSMVSATEATSSILANSSFHSSIFEKFSYSYYFHEHQFQEH